MRVGLLSALLCSSLAPAEALRIPGPRIQPKLRSVQRSAANSALAASLALIIGAADPSITSASTQPELVQQYGSSMVADELRPEQQKFLEERARMKQQYETRVEGNYKTEDEVRDKKGIYTTIVGGLIVVAFVAPMVSFFYYTGGK